MTQCLGLQLAKEALKYHVGVSRKGVLWFIRGYIWESQAECNGPLREFTEKPPCRSLSRPVVGSGLGVQGLRLRVQVSGLGVGLTRYANLSLQPLHGVGATQNPAERRSVALLLEAGADPNPVSQSLRSIGGVACSKGLSLRTQRPYPPSKSHGT